MRYLTTSQLEALRDRRYHRTQKLRVRTEDEAKAFVDEVGFCYLFGDRTVEMPTLWEAVCGERRSVPRHHRDPDLGRTWRWKDTLPSRGEIYYGKLLRGKPTLVSLQWLPYFYALSPNYGEVEDYLLEYEEGRMSAEAKAIYEVLIRHGAMATSHLRRLSGLSGGGVNARRFDRAIAELQVGLKIVKVGISDANRWGYAYVYDVFLRRLPQVPEQARHISSDRAMEALFLQYLYNVVAEAETRIRRVFRWEAWEWERLMSRLRSRGLIEEVRIEGMTKDCWALAQDRPYMKMGEGE